MVKLFTATEILCFERWARRKKMHNTQPSLRRLILFLSHAAKLHRYGEVDLGLSQPLDPAIDRLVQIAAELAQLAA
jgi:hypothetical protein